jgi:hypothetical protein
MVLTYFHHSWVNRLTESSISHGPADVGQDWRFFCNSWASRCRFGDVWSGDIHIYGDFCLGGILHRNHSRSVPVCPEIFTPESGFRRCTSEVSLLEHSVCPEIFTPESGFRRCTSEESLQECSSLSGDVYTRVWMLEIHFGGTTPGVFQSVCILEMHSRGTTPGAFCVSRDLYSGVWILEMYFGGISPGAFRVSGDFYSGVWMLEIHFGGITPGVFQCICNSWL